MKQPRGQNRLIYAWMFFPQSIQKNQSIGKEVRYSSNYSLSFMLICVPSDIVFESLFLCR